MNSKTPRGIAGALLDCVTWGVAFAAFSHVSVSSAENSDTLEQITVTAQKREENLQNVGVSITALSADDLRSRGLTDTLQLGSSIPNLQFNSASGGNFGAQLTIRGVAQSDSSPHQESPNSMYIDEVYISAPNAQGSQMFDLQRVEALRGPQGTLFGRNSTGGNVSFFTNQPTKEFQGYADITYGEFDKIRVESAVGGSLTDSIQGRIAVASQNNRGYVTNYAGADRYLDGTNFYGLRGALAFDLDSSLRAILSFTFLHDNDHEGQYGHVVSFYDPNDHGRPAALPANVDFYGTGPGNDAVGYRSPYTDNSVDQTYDGFLNRSVMSPTLKVVWDMGGGTSLTSITNFTKLLFNYGEDCSSAPQFTCADPFKQNMSQYSEEMRLAGHSGNFTWVGGVYGLRITQNTSTAFIEPYFSGTPYAFDSFEGISQRLQSEAAFGQLEYAFDSHWKGIFGVRVTHDDKKYSSQTYYNEAGDFVSADDRYNPPLLVADFSNATVGGLADSKDTYVTGKAEIDYVINPDALLFASVARGAKGAGFNTNVGGSLPASQIPFAAEHMFAYEVGEKLTLLGNHLTVNTSAFYYNYGAFQTFENNGVGLSVVRDNKAHFYGGEIEIAAKPFRGLDMKVALTHLNTTVFDVATANLGVVDQQANGAPHLSGNALVRYTWNVTDTGQASVQWSGDFIGGRFSSIDNTPASYIHGSAGQNVRVGYSQGQWEFALYCDNVFNRLRQTFSYDNTAVAGYLDYTYMPPRWWNANVHYRF